MTQRTHCIYCNKEITKRSSEHVIQNALGGLLESEDICCPECNNFISKHIDAPFTKIFNPIISQIDNFSKTNNTKSLPPCTGKAKYNGKIYNVNIKGDKVVSCPELSREIRGDISHLPLEIVEYNFDLQNSAFKTGIAKIAFNYAMSQNIDFKYLEPGLKVIKSGNIVRNIEYDYNLIPFCPMNPVDISVELNNKQFEPFHNMILFSQHNELWCYVDLFNTFQYYVLLSNNMPKDKTIYANYTQTLQKLDRTIPDLSDLRKPENILIYAQQYGVKPCMDITEFTRRIRNAIGKKSQKISMAQIYTPRIERTPIELMMGTINNPYLFYHALCLYFDNDEFQTENFRTLTTSQDYSGIISYPHEIMKHNEIIAQYTRTKFNLLNQYLCKKTL